MKVKQMMEMHSVKRWSKAAGAEVYTFEVMPWKSSTNPHIGEVEVIFDAPDDYDHILGKINALKNEINTALDQYTATRLECEAQISKLLALENNGRQSFGNPLVSSLSDTEDDDIPF